MAAGEPNTASSLAQSGTIHLLREYGVVHLSGALSTAEQRRLFATIKGSLRAPSKAIGTAEFHTSSGGVGSSTHQAALHALGEKLYMRCAVAVAEETSAAEIAAEPALERLGLAHR